MEQYITIAGTRYLGVTRIRPDRTNSISKHTLEDGSKTGDHLVIGQPVIDAEITLFTGQYQQLQQLATSQQLITVTIPQGTYTNMALTRLTDEYGSTADTTKCKITLEQIRIVQEVLHSRSYNPDIHDLIKGIMIESYLEDGSQKIGANPHVFGKSITDPCLGWEKSEALIYDIYKKC